MSATTQPSAQPQPSNGQTATTKRTIRKRRRTARATRKTPAPALGAMPRKQPAAAATTATRTLPRNMPQTLVSQAAGVMPSRLFALGQTLPPPGTRFPPDQRAGWLKYAEAILIDAYPESKAA